MRNFNPTVNSHGERRYFVEDTMQRFATARYVPADPDQRPFYYMGRRYTRPQFKKLILDWFDTFTLKEGDFLSLELRALSGFVQAPDPTQPAATTAGVGTRRARSRDAVALVIPGEKYTLARTQAQRAQPRKKKLPASRGRAPIGVPVKARVA